MYRFGVAAIFGLLVVIAVTFGISMGRDGDANAQATEFKTHDDLLLDVANLVPEFGGKFISEDGDILYVHVTEGSEETLDAEHLKRAIEGSFTTRVTRDRELRLIPAKYSMHQLHEWYTHMQDEVWRNPNVVMTDLQEAENRIEVGVDNVDAVSAIEATVAALGVPNDAILVEVRERLVLESHTLQDRATGGVMEGGYQISSKYEDEQGRTILGNCTLGFNVFRSRGNSGEAGFINAGHCTEDSWDGGVDHTKFYQPDTTDSANLIGKEKIDPPFSSGLTGCPSGKVCRWSDSAFVGFTPGDWTFGRIAKTGYNRTSVNHDAKFRIVKDIGSISVGDVVSKVGRTTGWTNATVDKTCTIYDYEADLNRHLLCQATATMRNSKTDGGDSGAPVFIITNSPSTNDVELVGIHISGGPDKDKDGNVIGWFVAFSPIGGVYRDLGVSDTWDSCDTSIGC